MVADADRWYRAVLARDARFDGRFVVGSRSTGTYCRPSCATRRPRRANAVFFASWRAAEAAGLRACMRCRPAAAAASFVADAVARIDGGAGSVADIARAVGVSPRTLRRAMQAELGMSPIELAQSRRLAMARQLVEDTALPMTEIAFASGFRSLRRFNALFAAAHGVPPSRLRATEAATSDSIALRLAHRGPLDWAAMLAYLGPHLVPGVERADRFAYARLARFGARRGWIAVYPRVNQDVLIAEIATPLVPDVVPIVARLRRLFDLDADITTITEHLGPAVVRPGLRVPGAFDGFEAAVVALVGARVAGRLAAAFGEACDLPEAPLERLPFDAAALARAARPKLAQLGVRRPDVLVALARAVVERRLSLEPSGDPARVVAQLAELAVPPAARAIIALRALRDPDVLPRAIAPDRAAPWRPWRAYGALQLWAHEELS